MEDDSHHAPLRQRGPRANFRGDLEKIVPPVSVVTAATDNLPTLLSGGITSSRSVGQPLMPTPVREANGRFRRGAPSPNPTGRAPVAPEVKEAAQAHTLEMLSVLVSVAKDNGAPPAARVAAANSVLDRGHGKPMANLEAKVATVDVNQMHLDALRDLSRLP